MSGQLKANIFIIISFLSNRVIINAAIVLMRLRVNEFWELCSQRFFGRPAGDGMVCYYLNWLHFVLSALYRYFSFSFVLYCIVCFIFCHPFIRFCSLIEYTATITYTHKMTHPHLLPLAHPYANLIACLPVY